MEQDNQYLEKNARALSKKLQNIITGRDKEIYAIKMQFNRVLEGHSAITAIAGDIGIGKTTLVKAVLADLSKFNGTCVYSKFEQYKEQEPYIAIIQIIENITNHILTLPAEKLSFIRKELKKELGKDGALITDIAPQTERIIGKLRKIKVNDYKRLKIRLEQAFQTFITIAARELYPLIIAIDDLQWVDKPSWNILKSINDPLSGYDLYMILSYRNNFQEYQTRMKSIINELANNMHLLEIELLDISNEDIKAMLLNIFEGKINASDYIAQIIYRKTLGNPLYIKQILHIMLDNKLIYYDINQNKWYSKPENFDTFNLPIGLEDIIRRKIHNLNNDKKELLEIVACIGNRFGPRLITKIIETENDSIEQKLGYLCSTGLIVEASESSENRQVNEYEFSHDRITQIVYEQMNPDRRERLHFNIAMLFLNQTDQTYVEENLLSITAHLLNCRSIVLRESEKDKLTVYLYFAGMKAKQSAAVEHALKIFHLCEELLGNSCWQEDYAGTLKIKLELAECEFICGRYNAAEAHFEEMLANATGDEDLAQIKKRYMILHSYNGNHDKVLEMGIQALEHLGFNINIHRLLIQIAKEIIYGKVLFRNSRLEAVKNAPIVQDKRVTNALEILTIMAPSANLTNEDLFALIVLKIGNLSAKHGNSLYSPVGYAAYSLVLGSVLGDFQKAKKVEEISLSMVEIIDDEALKCTTYFVIGTFINHWTSPVRQSFNYLQKSFDCGMRSGEFFYSGFTVASMTEMQYSMGVPLQELKRFLELHRRYGKKMNHDNLLRLIRIFTDHIRELTAADFSLVDRLIDEEEISKLNTMEGMTYYLLKLQRLYLEGSIEEAYYLSQKTIKQLDSVRGYFLQVDFVFYFLLLNLEKKKHQKDFPESRDEKIFLKYRKKLQNWAEMSPENHGGKHLLIEALSRSLSKQKQDVVQLYDEAIEHAKTKHNLLLEALGNYLAADYYRSNRKIERVFARDACQLFNQWGSEKTANRIGKLYEINDYFAVDAESIVGTAAEIDDDTGSQKKISSEQRLQDCQKDLEVLELEAAYKYFLNTICKEAKADLGVILLEKEDQIRLEYMWQYGEETFSLAGIEIEELENLPKKVFRYAGRTYEKVIIESKPKEGPFANDDYIGDRAEISIICLPLKYNDIFVGLIYLESQNNYQFNPMIAKYIKRLSFYLVAKHALEKGSEKSAKMFTNNTVNEQLTNREVEVLYYMAEGMSNKEIANKLYISLSTVKTHTLNIYGKLEVSSRVQAVTKAKKLGLV